MQATLLLLLATCGVYSQETANPKIPFYGYGAIVASPSIPVAGEVTDITVTVENTGVADAKGVDVVLSSNDWGATFGGWVEIGVQTVDIPGNSEVQLSFSAVFDSAAHTCLQAQVGSVAEGGNSNENDDRGQINLEVINSGGNSTYAVPIRNNEKEEITVQVQAFCPQRMYADPIREIIEQEPQEPVSIQIPYEPLKPSDPLELPDPLPQEPSGRRALASDNLCPQVRGLYVDGAPMPRTLTIPAGGEVWVEVDVELEEADVDDVRRSEKLYSPYNDGLKRFDLVVEATKLRTRTLEPVYQEQDQLTKSVTKERLVISETVESPTVTETITLVVPEKEHVLLRFEKSELAEMLNWAHLCCIANVRVRVYLEAIVVKALYFYEQGDAASMMKAMQLLREFMAQATDIGCDGNPEQKDCIDKAMRVMLDAGRLMAEEMAAKAGVAPRSSAAAQPAPQIVVERAEKLAAPVTVGEQPAPTIINPDSMLPERLRQASVRGDNLRQRGLLQASLAAYAAPLGRQSFAGQVQLAWGAVYGGADSPGGVLGGVFEVNGSGTRKAASSAQTRPKLLAVQRAGSKKGLGGSAGV